MVWWGEVGAEVWCCEGEVGGGGGIIDRSGLDFHRSRCLSYLAGAGVATGVGFFIFIFYQTNRL